MLCPKCGQEVDVVDSRWRKIKNGKPVPIFRIPGGDGIGVRRRRNCNSCGYRFGTYEITDEFFRSLVADRMRLHVMQSAISGTVVVPPKINSPMKALDYLGQRGRKKK